MPSNEELAAIEIYYWLWFINWQWLEWLIINYLLQVNKQGEKKKQNNELYSLRRNFDWYCCFLTFIKVCSFGVYNYIYYWYVHIGVLDGSAGGGVAIAYAYNLIRVKLGTQETILCSLWLFNAFSQQ